MFSLLTDSHMSSLLPLMASPNTILQNKYEKQLEQSKSCTDVKCLQCTAVPTFRSTSVSSLFLTFYLLVFHKKYCILVLLILCVCLVYRLHKKCQISLFVFSSAGSFRYSCDICGKKYKYYSCFQEHRDLHAVDGNQEFLHYNTFF